VSALRCAALALCALLAASAARSGAAERSRGVTILMYHKVDRVVPGDAVGASLTIDPAVFEGQLAWLKAHRIRTLTTQELAAALARGERPHDAVVLSFDDGYEDAATVVAPLLAKYGARASFYVSADLIGTPRHASWRQLRAMRRAGMEIGCHGSRHLDLTTLSTSGQAYEIGHCAAALARYLGPPRTYAYAAGRYDAVTLGLLKTYGFEAALTEHPGTVTQGARPLELPRRRVDRSDSVAAFAWIVSP